MSIDPRIKALQKRYHLMDLKDRKGRRQLEKDTEELEKILMAEDMTKDQIEDGYFEAEQEFEAEDELN